MVQDLGFGVRTEGLGFRVHLTKTCRVSEFEKKLRLADTQNLEKSGDPS